MPAVSVVMSCYNAESHVVAALDSIVEQTFADWELIVVNDGSTDGTGDILDGYAERDVRVRVLHQGNHGQQHAANQAISQAKSDLIARMDADDIAAPNRLELQINFMTGHPDVCLLGGQIKRIGDRGGGLVSNFPLGHENIVKFLCRNHHSVCNPTVIFRKVLFDQIGGYWEHDIAEDWDMFLRMSEHGQLANLPEVLLSYRFHETSINGRRIVEAQLYNEFAAENFQRRQKGVQELTIEEFRRAHRSNRLFGKIAFNLDSHSIGQYRRAVAELYGGRLFIGCGRLIFSMMMSPGRTMRRIGNILARRVSKASV
ncbi:MAG: glycosyltransferase [Planctomycetota bacterium]